jgi:hypothetical protein
MVDALVDLTVVLANDSAADCSEGTALEDWIGHRFRPGCEE